MKLITTRLMNKQSLPDVVKGLCLVDNDAACGTPVAIEEVLHDADFTNWKEVKHKAIRGQVQEREPD